MGNFIGSRGNEQFLLTICFLFSSLWCFFWLCICADSHTELGNFVILLQSKTHQSFGCFRTLSCSASFCVWQPNLLWDHYVAKGSKLTADIWVVMAVSNSIHELILEMYRFIFVILWEKLQDMPVTSATTSWGWWMHNKKVSQKVDCSFPLCSRCLGIDTLTLCTMGSTMCIHTYHYPVSCFVADKRNGTTGMGLMQCFEKNIFLLDESGHGQYRNKLL